MVHPVESTEQSHSARHVLTKEVVQDAIDHNKWLVFVTDYAPREQDEAVVQKVTDFGKPYRYEFLRVVELAIMEALNNAIYLDTRAEMHIQAWKNLKLVKEEDKESFIVDFLSLVQNCFDEVTDALGGMYFDINKLTFSHVRMGYKTSVVTLRMKNKE